MKSLTLLAGLCALVFPSFRAHGQLVITEVMPKNEDGLKDEDGERPDWLELHNHGSDPVALDAYALSDNKDQLAGWQLPKRTLKGGEFLIVFASGKDRRLESGPPHTDFKLEAKGEYLAVVRIADEKVVHAYDPKFLKVRKGQSCGLRFEGAKVLTDNIVLFDTPTPGMRNGDSVAKPKVADTKFSVDRGFFDAPFDVELSSKTPGARIHYTLDGSPPSENHGTLSGEPIAVESTTVLRVMAFKDGHEPTNIDTATYIFPAKVVAQPSKPEGWPTHYAASERGSFFRFGGRGSREVAIDYAMSPPEATGATSAEIEAALRSIPTLSLVTDQKHLFDKEDGIFQNPDQRGREAERPLSVELIDPSGSEKGFQVNAGVRIRGGHSRRVECQKHGMRLYFRKEYGAGKLDYPLFGDEGVSSFDDIDLRTAQNYSYHYSSEGDQNTMVREVFCRDSQAALGQPYTRSRYYHLYINGLYWGLYQTQEHAEASFAAAYFGGEKEDYDTVKNRSGIGTSATDGTDEGWRHLWETSAKIAASDSAEERLRLYRELQGLTPDGMPDPDRVVYLDADNLIDYMLVIFFTGSFDGPITNFANNRVPNNWFSVWQRGGRSGFKFFCHDSEHTLGSQRQLAEVDRVGPFPAGQAFVHSNPQWIHQQLTAVADYRDRFRARTEETLLGDGPLALKANLIRLRHRAQEVGRAIPAEIARWGDTRNRGGWKKQDWDEAIAYVEEVLEMRSELVLDQLGSAKRYAKGIPSSSLTDAPLFNPVRRPGFRQNAEGEGTFQADGGVLYYTLDGTDPKGADGKPTVSAKTARADSVTYRTLLAADAAVRVKVPIDGSLERRWVDPEFDDGAWTRGKGGVGYEVGEGYESLIGVNIRDHIYGGGTSAYVRYAFEFPENVEYERVSLRLKFEDGFIAYINGDPVAKQNSGLLPSWDSAARGGHEDTDAVRWSPFDITDSKDRLQEGRNVLAVHLMNERANSFDLLLVSELRLEQDVPGTVIKVDANARLIARVFAGDEWSPPYRSWKVVPEFHAPASAKTAVVSEIMYHPAEPSSAEARAGFTEESDFEFLELANVGAEPIDLGGVYCRDGIHFLVSKSVVIPPAGCAVIARNPEAFALRYPGQNAVASFLGNLGNKNDALTIRDAGGNVLAALAYEDDSPWPSEADGEGYSLVLKKPTAGADMSDPANWPISDELGGSPGRLD